MLKNENFTTIKIIWIHSSYVHENCMTNKVISWFKDNIWMILLEKGLYIEKMKLPKIYRLTKDFEQEIVISCCYKNLLLYKSDQK